MRIKLLSRLLCALLSVLMLLCMIPAITVSASTAEATTNPAVTDNTKVVYGSAEEAFEAMTPMYDNGKYSLRCDTALGTVAYRNNATGEILFTNPWNMSAESNTNEALRSRLNSQITLSFGGKKSGSYNSYDDAVKKGQITVKPIKGGLRVEYVIGERSARVLLPRTIERLAFEEKILIPLSEKAPSRDFTKFYNYYNKMFYASYMEEGKTAMAEAIAKEAQFAIAKEKYIDIYVLQGDIPDGDVRELEAMILEYCPDYNYEELDNDHAYVEYEEESMSPCVFKMALEYTLDEHGLVVTLPANGMRYDETAYRINTLCVLPYMGASEQTSEGYSFVPDGSGALFALNENLGKYDDWKYDYRVYGNDFSLGDISGAHSQTIRMPVFGQVETPVLEDGTKGTSRGYLAIIEAGESLASIKVNHPGEHFTSVIPSFVSRQSDTARSGDWSVYASRRYVEDYRIRYIMLSDDTKAQNASLSSYYECSWMGMACAYRDYLDATSDGYNRLTADNTKSSIPLYIETFGCMDSLQKVLSMPVTISMPLTTFEDVATMYDYLAGEGVTNVNFKMTGYANGGLYSEVPYKLKWESAVGGSSGFEDLSAYAAEKGFGLYPDFDFVFTSRSDGGSKVNMKKNAARTIDNRYTTRRVYSATKQSMVSYYQMVLSPDTYSDFYEKLAKRYAKYENASGISLATFGNALNSDFDENKTILREEAKHYVMEALEYFGKDYNVMLDGANAFTWSYADHILNVPLDSSRYNYEMYSVPFMGMVLHGYVEFAGTPFNKEGNMRYAMLKAMESGASLYFVLSYANTELLKEDVLLSQNYSIRYDIWQSKLVDVYAELNAVLADVQTKLLIDHQFLDGKRVPDEDELLADIVADAEKKAAEIEAQIKKDHDKSVARLREYRIIATTAVSKIAALTDYKALINQERASQASTTAQFVKNNWNALLNEDAPDATAIASFQTNFRRYIVDNYINLQNNMMKAAGYVIEARNAYDALLAIKNDPNLPETNVRPDDALLEAAEKGVQDAENAYLSMVAAFYGLDATLPVDDADYVGVAILHDAYNDVAVPADLAARVQLAEGDALTVADAHLRSYLLGNAMAEDVNLNELYAGIGAKALYEAFVALLKEDGFYIEDNAETLEQNECIEVGTGSVVLDDGSVLNSSTTTDSDMDDSNEETVTEKVFDKYAIDNNSVLVTYGENGQAFKSLILNFNDYTVQTTFNGVIYTIEEYGYVVIYH